MSMDETVGLDYEAECKRLTEKLQSQKEGYNCEIARLHDTLEARKKDIETKQSRIDILEAKLSVIEIIFGK